MYLIKWRADYVTNYFDEAVTSRSIEDVHGAYQQGNGKLKIKLFKFLKPDFFFWNSRYLTNRTYMKVIKTNQKEHSRNGINLTW